MSASGLTITIPPDCLILFEFDNLADAMTCRRRLLAEVAQ